MRIPSFGNSVSLLRVVCYLETAPTGKGYLLGMIPEAKGGCAVLCNRVVFIEERLKSKGDHEAG